MISAAGCGEPYDGEWSAVSASNAHLTGDEASLPYSATLCPIPHWGHHDAEICVEEGFSLVEQGVTGAGVTVKDSVLELTVTAAVDGAEETFEYRTNDLLNRGQQALGDEMELFWRVESDGYPVSEFNCLWKSGGASLECEMLTWWEQPMVIRELTFGR